MSITPGAQFQPASDRSLLVSFGGEITRWRHEQVAKLLRFLELEHIPGLHNFHPAYSSLLITFDCSRWTHRALEEVLCERLERADNSLLIETRRVELSVCYGGESGPDLEDVASLRGLTAEDVIRLHSSTDYVVYFLGFVPGFAYLGDLPDALLTPRLATPRRSVPPGSVGIAGRQTGVYPLPTPGGWRVIGRTPLRMFDPETGSRLRIGDRVRFVPISKEQYAALEQEQATP